MLIQLYRYSDSVWAVRVNGALFNYLHSLYDIFRHYNLMQDFFT